MKYVLGFAKNIETSEILLIKKNRPAWQQGFLNGIGGKLEPDDYINGDSLAPQTGMAREFKEECGIATLPSSWKLSGSMYSTEEDWKVFILAIELPSELYNTYRSMESEVVTSVLLSDITFGFRSDIRFVSNLPWLLPLVLSDNLSQFNLEYLRKSNEAD